MSKYKCVIFDCDGVLIDSEMIATKTMVDMANDLGVSIEIKDALSQFKGKSFSTCMEIVSTLLGKPLPETFEADYRAKSFEAFKENIKPIAGIKTVLQHLELPFCTASSGPEDKIRLNLGLSGLLPFFENNIFSCYTIKKWKPDPAIFLWAAETMGFKPSECVVVEDSLTGVRAAKSGGFDVFGFTAHDYDNELEKEATKTFGSMSEFLEMI
ncbi:HAD family hydrolase [Flavivirga spongiicola]|uniref:HAD-IA family hydrolase n=1 Tax=Flavivirga spongiicola TaxID=421621 RepID=A0ABU7XQN5_9FLAO|nr:HAD-IA family hydrolase [Flavivirga sp. MEBiC05379]MDO5978081.1 HAD-IA family hydrolase [Flavivirga sp. MEBiC05379]